MCAVNENRRHHHHDEKYYYINDCRILSSCKKIMNNPLLLLLTKLRNLLTVLFFLHNITPVFSQRRQALPLEDSCRQVPSVENGYPSLLTSQPFLTAWQVNCNPYYRLVGAKLITCTLATGWSRYGKCLRRLECGQVPGIPNGYITYSGPAGSADTEPSRNVKCNRGFELVGNDTITCDESGKWSSPGTCRPLFNCEFELEITNGYAQINQWNPNTATVKCCGGYQLRGQDNAVCNSATNWQWQWSGKCVATKWLQLYCGPTPIVQNGYVASISCSEFGAIRNVYCNAGYVIRGDTVTECTPPGYWSQPGQCIPAASTTTKSTTITRTRPTTIIITTGFTSRTAFTSTTKSVTTTRLVPAQTSMRTVNANRLNCGPPKKYQSFALIQAIRNGNRSTFLKELESGADPDSMNALNWTALSVAADSGRAQFLGDLLACGASVDAKNPTGSTALMFASKSGSTASVQLLINAKANPNLRNNYGSNALLLSSQNGFSKIVQLLLRNRADFTIRDGEGNTPLHLAVRGNHTETVQTLLEYGVAIDAQNRYGQTPLMLAAFNNYYLVAKTLLDFGAQISITDFDSRTALNYAQDHKNIQQVLQQQRSSIISSNDDEQQDGALLVKKSSPLRNNIHQFDTDN